jgi:phosphoenolpyruvate carboxylase
MENPARLKAFEKEVKKKFDVYNSLFLNLPFRKVSNIGMLIPLLQQCCKQGLDSGRDPLDILDSFFSNHTNITTEEEKIQFMFHVIRYVERQVVLYDSVEDAAFEQLVKLDDHLSLKDSVTLLAGNQKWVQPYPTTSPVSVRASYLRRIQPSSTLLRSWISSAN